MAEKKKSNKVEVSLSDEHLAFIEAGARIAGVSPEELLSKFVSDYLQSFGKGLMMQPSQALETLKSYRM